MKADKINLIQLSQIAPNPLNPRKNFTGQKFDELAESIRAKGVYSPILVRPLADKRKKAEYEIIFGERRWRAACVVGQMNGGLDANTIPAIVKDMTDDEVFDAIMIENLQREDLTELEEAESFKAFLDKHGKDAVPMLSERLSKHPRYIQRRVAVLALPKPALKAWAEGKIMYGHCEQLMRLKDPGRIKELLNQVLSETHAGEAMTVRALQTTVDREAVDLSWAKFDKKKEGCIECLHNSEIQQGLFGDEYGSNKPACVDARCFEKKQAVWLKANWSKYAKDAGTNGFRFKNSLKYNEYETFEEWKGKPGEKCADCPDFVSLVTIRGKMENKQACLGGQKCYSENLIRSRSGSGRAGGDTRKGKAEKKDGPRVAWHGHYFRQKFYHERIGAVLGAKDADDVHVLRAALFSIFKSDSDAKSRFAADHKIIPGAKAEYVHVSNEAVWKKIMQLDGPILKEEIKKAAIRIVLKENLMYSNLGIVSDHLGISLAGEYRIDQDYLDKKTIGEIHDLGEKLGIFADEKAQSFLHETLGKKRGKFNSCKKDELIRVILESGVDLAGKVPEEILDLKTADDRRMEDDGVRICENCGGVGMISDDEDCPECDGLGEIPIDQKADTNMTEDAVND